MGVRSSVAYLTLFLFTEEFQRAVRISTGHTLDPYVVHTVFQLFDKDGEFVFVVSPVTIPRICSTRRLETLTRDESV